MLRSSVLLAEEVENIVDIAELRADLLIGESLAAGIGKMGFEII